MSSSLSKGSMRIYPREKFERVCRRVLEFVGYVLGGTIVRGQGEISHRSGRQMLAVLSSRKGLESVMWVAIAY